MANTQLQDSMKMSFALVEHDNAGVGEGPSAGDTCTVTLSDPTLATVVLDPTPLPVTNADGSTTPSVASGFIVALPKAGTVTISGTIKHADGTDGPPVTSVPVDIIVGPASTASFSFGTPVAQ
jgi:hypothetical protein